jgi:hypothetical protein
LTWLTDPSAAIRIVACGVAPAQAVPDPERAPSGQAGSGCTRTSALIGKAAPGGVVTVTVTGSSVNAGTGA